MFRSMASPNFRRFFIGQLLSQNGTWAQLVAIDLLVFNLTDSGTAVGIATAARFGGTLLFGAWAGVLSDRMDRLRLLQRTNVAGMVVAVLFALLVASGVDQVGWIYLVAFIAGTVNALENPVRRSFVGELVDEATATNAIALNSAVLTASKITGPAIAGVVVATIGISWCFALNALSFLPQLWLLGRMDRRQIRSAGTISRQKGQLRQGFAYVWATPDLRQPLLMIFAISVLTFNYPVILPMFANRDLHGGDSTYTLLLSVMSIGSLIGALLVARLTVVTLDQLAKAALFLGTMSLLLAVAPVTAVAALAIIPVGVGTMVLISGANSLVQVVTVPHMRGRVMAIMSVVFVGATPIGGPLFGTIGEHTGARWAIAIGAVGALSAGVWAWRAARPTPVVQHRPQRCSEAPVGM